MSDHTVLVLGGTGRTGSRVVRQLLERDVRVRTLVRARERVSADVVDDPNLTIIEADPLAMSAGDFEQAVDGCDAVVSCLGHNLSLQGMYGAPRDLVTRAAQRVCSAAEDLQPPRPIRFILMSSVSVNHPAGTDARRGAAEKAVVAFLRGAIPPANDNQRASDFLWQRGADGALEWVAVRPDSLIEGDVCEYSLHDQLVDSLFAPGKSTMCNVADFMCELATDDATWTQWRGKLPVIVNAEES